MHITPERRWACPNCTTVDVTYEPRPHQRMHPCRGLAGLTVPMVPAGTRCVIEAVDRDDYVGRELVQVDGNGRPVMAAITRHFDGRQDVTVYAPAATAAAAAQGGHPR